MIFMAIDNGDGISPVFFIVPPTGTWLCIIMAGDAILSVVFLALKDGLLSNIGNQA